MRARGGQCRRKGIGPFRERLKIRGSIEEKIKHDRFRIHGQGVVPKQLKGRAQSLGQAGQLCPWRIEQSEPIRLRRRRKPSIQAIEYQLSGH